MNSDLHSAPARTRVSHYIATLITRWVLFVARHGRLVLVIILISTPLAGVWAVKLFSLDSDTEKLIKPNPERQWYQQNEVFNRAFPQFHNTALVVVSGRNLADVNKTSDVLLSAFSQSDWFHSVAAPGREPFFVEHLLYELSIDELTELSRQLQSFLPLLSALDHEPGLATFFMLVQQSLLRDRSSGALSNDSRVLLQRLLQASLSEDPVHWLLEENTLLARDIYQIIVLQGRQQFGESTPAKAVIESIHNTIAEHSPNLDGTRVRVTGELALADEEMRTALQGIQVAGIVSLVLLAIVLTFGVRSWTIVLAIFSLLATGVVWTCLFALLVVGSFNTLSLVFLVMFFGLGVDFAIHFCLRIQESLSSPDESQCPLHSATEDIGTALLLCTMTSGIAFLSFLPTEYRGLAELGIISAGGISIAFILTLTLLPAWFSVVAMPVSRRDAPPQKLHFGMDQFRPASILGFTVLLGVTAVWFAKDVQFDYSVLGMRDKSSEAMDTLLEMQREQLSTDYSVSVLVPPDEIDGLVPKLMALPSVAGVETPQNRIAADQMEKQGILAPLQAYRELRLQTPDTLDNTQVAAAQDALMSQLAHSAEAVDTDDRELLLAVKAGLLTLQSETERQQLQNRLVVPLFNDTEQIRQQVLAQAYTLEDLPAVARARLIAPDGRHLLVVLPQEQLDELNVMDQFVSEVEQVAPNIAGRTVVERGVGQLVVKSFRMAVVLALTGIFIVLVVYFRELLTPVLVLIPLSLTTLFTFAIVSVSGLTLNMANILVVPLIFGLGVDTGIHVVHRYHVAGNVSELLRSSTPRAVTLSALTTIGTFISLSFNPHQGAASIGLILSVAISLLMVVTFVVLPALLAVFEPKAVLTKSGNAGAS